MPVTYTIDKINGVVLSTGTGTVKGSDILRHVSRVLEDPDVPIPYRELFDLRKVKDLNVDKDDIRRIIAFAMSRKIIIDFGKVAYVDSRDYIFGIGRMFEAYSSQLPFDLMAFRRIEDARCWLGMRPEG